MPSRLGPWPAQPTVTQTVFGNNTEDWLVDHETRIDTIEGASAATLWLPFAYTADITIRYPLPSCRLDGLAYRNGGAALAYRRYIKQTNLLDPNAFGGAGWTADNVTRTSNSTTGPDGSAATANADTITPTATSGNVRQRFTPVGGGTIADGRRFHFGVHLKSSTGSNHLADIVMRHPDSGQSTTRNCTVTTDWQYFEVSHTHTTHATPDDELQVYIYPGQFGGTLDGVYAWNAVCYERVTITSSLVDTPPTSVTFSEGDMLEEVVTGMQDGMMEGAIKGVLL